MTKKVIPGHPNYRADRKGQIWRKHYGRWIKVNPVTHHDGYQYTHIDKTKQLTQRLVCAAFKGEHPPELPICIRKAKRQQPRRVRSQKHLKWGTTKGRKRSRKVTLTHEQKLQIVDSYKMGNTQIMIAKMFGVSQAAISYIVNGRVRV